MKFNLIDSLKESLQNASDETTRQSSQRYFKEKMDVYGVKAARVKSIAQEYYVELKKESKNEVFNLCEALFGSGKLEESFIACHWCFKRKKEFLPEDFKLFESWIDRYIKNWATCDTFCNQSVGAFLLQYPEFLPELFRWARSENLWMRRAAAVSLIVPARKGLFYKEIMTIASLLLEDQEDMVQKGYGWLLKVNTNHYEEEVFNFVVKNKANMPRTALRYAIEKMPPEMKAIAMKRDF